MIEDGPDRPTRVAWIFSYSGLLLAVVDNLVNDAKKIRNAEFFA